MESSGHWLSSAPHTGIQVQPRIPKSQGCEAMALCTRHCVTLCLCGPFEAGSPLCHRQGRRERTCPPQRETKGEAGRAAGRAAGSAAEQSPPHTHTPLCNGTRADSPGGALQPRAHYVFTVICRPPLGASRSFDVAISKGAFVVRKDTTPTSITLFMPQQKPDSPAADNGGLQTVAGQSPLELPPPPLPHSPNFTFPERNSSLDALVLG